MKPVFPCVLVVALLSACTHRNVDWPVAFLGDPAPVTAATKTVVIRPDTRWVNVTGGDIVKFVVGDKSFAWAFNVATGVSHFELNRVAPPGVLAQRVEAYVAPDPKYLGSDGNRDGI